MVIKVDKKLKRWNCEFGPDLCLEDEHCLVPPKCPIIKSAWFDKNGKRDEDDNDVLACLCNTIDDDIKYANYVEPFVYGTTLDVQLKRGDDIMLKSTTKVELKKCLTYYKLELLNEYVAVWVKTVYEMPTLYYIYIYHKIW